MPTVYVLSGAKNWDCDKYSYVQAMSERIAWTSIERMVLCCLFLYSMSLY